MSKGKKQEISYLGQNSINQGPEENLCQGILVSIKDDDDNSNEFPSLNSINMSQYKQTYEDSMNQVVVGNKKNTPTLQQSCKSNSLSFDAFNQPSNSIMFKSKQSTIARQSKDQAQRSNSKDSKIILNQSIFTDKLNNIVKNQSQEQIEKEVAQQASNYEKSFYLTNNNQATNPINTVVKVQEWNKNEIHVIFRNTKYFLQIQDQSVQVNQKSLQDLYNQLLKKQIFTPIFNYEIFDSWNLIKDSSKYEESSQSNRHLKVYLDKYIEYLNKHYQISFVQVLKIVKCNQQGRNSKKESLTSTSYFHFDLSTLFDHFKQFISSSKSLVLKKTLLCKIRSLNSMLSEGTKWTMSSEEVLILSRMIDKTWIDLSKVELVLSFEQTEQYCQKKIENSPELKFKQIWIRYKELIRKESIKLMAQIDFVII